MRDYSNPHTKQPIGKSIIRIGRKPLKRHKRKTNKWVFLIKKAAELRQHPTAAETIFERKLQELGIKYVFQHPYYPYLYAGMGGISDFYLKKYRMAVEIDGGYHLDEDQQQTDRIKDFLHEGKLKKAVLRLTNQQAMYLSIEQIRTLIESKRGLEHKRQARRALKRARILNAIKATDCYIPRSFDDF